MELETPLFPFMENSIENFHLVLWNTSLISNFPAHIMHFCFSGVTSCILYFWMSSAASSSVAILCGWNINGVNDTHRTKTDIGNTITNNGNNNVPCALCK